MDITLLISDYCDACQRAVKKLYKIKKLYQEININIVDINSYNDNRIFITPALIINGELFSYGDIDEKKLLSILKRLR